MGDLTLKPNTQGKVAQTDYDFWLTQSDDHCLYCLSKREIAIVLTALPMSEWRTRWFSAIGTEPDMDLIQATIAKLEAELMTDNCDLTTKLDALITMVQGLEQMSCLSFDTAMNTYRQTLLAGGTPAGTPNTTWNYDTSDTTRNQQYARQQALCSALRRAIYSAVQQELAAGGLFVGGLAGIAGIINPILGIAVGVIGGLSLAAIQAASQDATAVSDVVCCAYKALDTAVSESSFRNCLNSCGFTAGTNQAILAGAAASCFNDALFGTSNYRAFQSVLGEEDSKAIAAGQSAPGDCEACHGCTDQAWDYRLGQRIITVFPAGTLTIGSGVVGKKITNSATGQFSDDFSIEIHFPTPCSLAGAHYSYEIFGGTVYVAGGSGWTMEWDNVSGVTTLITTFVSPNGTITGTNVAFSSGPSGVAVLRLRSTYFSGQSDLRRPIQFHSFALDFP